MKIYLAGKITGDENYREKFRKQEERLREEQLQRKPFRLKGA